MKQPMHNVRQSTSLTSHDHDMRRHLDEHIQVTKTQQHRFAYELTVFIHKVFKFLDLFGDPGVIKKIHKVQNGVTFATVEMHAPSQFLIGQLMTRRTRHAAIIDAIPHVTVITVELGS